MPADAALFMFLKVRPPPPNPQYSVIPFFSLQRTQIHLTKCRVCYYYKDKYRARESLVHRMEVNHESGYKFALL